MEGCDSTIELLPRIFHLGLCPQTPYPVARGGPTIPAPLPRLAHCVRSRPTVRREAHLSRAWGSRHLTARAPDFACRRAPSSRNSVACPHPRAGGSPSGRSSPRSGERRLMAREGIEPSKALGRQIYSLLRLTASLPRPNSRESAPKARFAALHETDDLSGFLRRFANFLRCDSWSWRRDLNPRPADYKSAALPD